MEIFKNSSKLEEKSYKKPKDRIQSKPIKNPLDFQNNLTGS